jgi:Glycosyltransferase family 87
MFARYPPAFRRLILGITALTAIWFVWGRFLLVAAINHQVGGDFGQYWLAAARFARGGSLYLETFLRDPIPAQAAAYLYPPAFAQLLAPLTGLPASVACAAFAVLSLAIFVVTTWKCAQAGGARGGVDLALGTALLLAAAFPVAFAVIFGNVEALLVAAITVALVARPSRGGLALALAVVLKVAPFALVPALASRSRLGLLAFCLALLAVVVVGIVLAPETWVAFPSILAHLAASGSDYPQNFAPAAVVATLAGPTAGSIVRIITLAVAGALVLLSALLARRPGGWPAALFAATFASLLVPATLWLHYPAILLPFIAFAWPRASTRTRLGIVYSLLFFDFWDMAAGVIGAVGLVLLGAVLLRSLWPVTGPPIVNDPTGTLQ